MSKSKTRIRKERSRRLCAGMMAFIMVMSIFFDVMPFKLTGKAYAADITSILADLDTSNKYTESLGDNASTEYSGRVWTDKTVSVNGQNFQIQYSALSTSKDIIGKTQAPIDVVFIIDISGSMTVGASSVMDNGSTRIENTVKALNDAIEAVMAMNEYTRVAVVAFSTTGHILLDLGRYTPNANGDYFSVNTQYTYSGTYWNQTKTPESATLNTVALGTSKSIAVSGGTNIQHGLYTGMNILATETETTVKINGTDVKRTPHVVLLSDGSPTYSVTNEAWWDAKIISTATSPSNWQNDGIDGPGSGARVGNGFKALLTASYMKGAIDRNYALTNSATKTSVYTIGMGIDDLTDVNEFYLAQMTLNPSKNWNQPNVNTMVSGIVNAWNTYKQGGQPVVEVDDERHTDWTDYDKNYTVKHPTTGFDITSINNYVDGHYDANNADGVTNAFKNIVESISITQAEAPTEVKSDGTLNTSELLDKSGYITYTDPIGEYMEVKSIDKLIYNDVNGVHEFVLSDDTKNGVTVGDTTTYTFAGTITHRVYGERDLSNIIITVKTTTTGNTKTQTITIKIPASLIPLRVNTVTLKEDGTIESHTNNGATPIRILYTVGLQENVVDQNGVVNTDVVSESYMEANKNADGTINFYSNLFTAGTVTNVAGETKTVGDATVEFEAAHSNPFYYIQDVMPIYTDKAMTTYADPTTVLNPTTVYYYPEPFYHGNVIENKAIERTGQQLINVGVSKSTDGTYWYQSLGTPRLNKIQVFEGIKKENATKTAEDFYVVTYNKTSDKFVAHFGNNGVLKVKATGNLEITKTVTAEDGLTAPDKEFTFTVTLTDTNTYSYVVKDAEGKIVQENGTITSGGTIVLKAGQTATIEGLVGGTKYTVEERSESGFITSSANATGTIVVGETKTAVFTNHYSATGVLEGDVYLKGEKILLGRDWEQTGLKDASFTFQLSAVDNAPLPNKTQIVVTSKDAKAGDAVAFHFEDIIFSKEGVYQYEIREIIPTVNSDERLAAVSYSRELYKIFVTVVDNGDGTLAISSVMKRYHDVNGNVINNGEGEATVKENTATFTNTFVLDSEEWTFVGTKEYTDFSGNKPLVADMFHFTVTAVGSTNGTLIPMPGGVDGIVGSTVHVHNAADGSIQFSQISFGMNDVGHTYTYEIKEENTKIVGMTYDDTVYLVTVTVSVAQTNGGQDYVKVTPVYTVKDAATTATINRVTFTNEYKPNPVEVELEGEKVLTGRNMKTGETFTFTLNATGTNVLFDGVKTVTIDQTGKFVFEKLTITQPGVYTFEMKETAGNAGGMTYDTHVCTVVVTVTDHNGVLKADVIYNGGNTFTNIYKTNGSNPINLEGTKTLTGQPLTAGRFFFTVTPVNNAPMGDSLAFNGNDANGKIKLLQNIVYTSAGTYEYVIAESIPKGAENDKLNGITYDQTKYTVVVTVTDDGNGNLNASVKVNGEPNGMITFGNIYTTGNVTYQPVNIKKILNGRILTAGEFKVVMTAVENPNGGMTLPSITTVSNDVDGNFNFGVITFTKPGTYKVQVKEVLPTKESESLFGVAYDEHVCIATFTVVDDGKGNLTATRSSQIGIAQFTNTYTPPVKEQAVNGGAFTTTTQKVVAGDTVTYRVTVQNPGLVDVTNVTVTDKIPEGLTFVSAGQGGAYSNGTVTWKIAKIEAGKSAEVTFDVKVPTVKVDTTWVNGATVTYNGDNYPSNEVEIKEELNKLSIQKDQSIDGGANYTTRTLTVVDGSEVVYRITVTNNGVVDAVNVTIKDAIPVTNGQSLKLVDGSISDGGTVTNGVITWVIDKIEAGKSVEVTFKVTVPDVSVVTTWTNGASYSYENNPEGSDKVYPSNTVDVVEGVPAIEIEKVQSLNNGTATKELLTVVDKDQVTYTIIVKNTGSEAALRVVVTDKIPEGLQLVENSISDNGVKDSEGNIIWTIDTIAAGASKSVSFTVTVPDVDKETTWTNIASVKYGNHPTNPNYEKPSNEVKIKEGIPSLDIEKLQSVNNGTPVREKLTVVEDDIVTYYISIKNNGSEAATNVVITDRIPEGLTFVSVGQNGKYTGGRVIWNVGTLNVGEEKVVSFSVKVPDVAQDTTWLNTAQYSFGNNPENDPSKPDEPKKYDSNTVEIFEGVPSLTIEKLEAVNDPKLESATRGTLLPVLDGDKVYYHIIVRNKGTEAATNVVITDKVPEGLTFVSAKQNGVYDNGTVTWTIASIPVDGEVVVQFIVEVPDVDKYTIWENTAKVSYENNPKNPTDPTKPNVETESNKVEIAEGVPMVVIEKLQSKDGGTTKTRERLTVVEGDQVIYYLTVKNNGSEEAKNIVITDKIPSGLGFVSAEDGGVHENGIVSWTIASLAVGKSATVRFTVSVPNVKQYTIWENVAQYSYENNPENPEDPNEPDTVYDSNNVDLEQGIPIINVIKSQAVNGNASGKARPVVVEGDQVTYYLTVYNYGNEVAKNITITDKIPVVNGQQLQLVAGSITGGGTVNANGVITWVIPELGIEQNNMTAVVSFTVVIPDVNQFTVWPNVAQYSYENNPENPEDPNEPDKIYNTNIVEVEEGVPVVQIEKLQSLNGTTATKDRLTVVEGDQVTYYLTVTNRGTEAALNVTITDKIPSGLGFVSVADGGSHNNGVVTWTIASLGVNESKTVRFTVSVPDVAEYTLWQNMAQYSYENNPSNPEDPNAPDSVYNSNIVEIEQGAPAVRIEKEQSKNGQTATKNRLTVVAGDHVTYYLTVTNSGSEAATNVVITDKIPAGLDLVANTISDGGSYNNGVVSWTIASLGVNESKTVRFTVSVPDVAEYTLWQNIAQYSYENNPENPENPNAPDVVYNSNIVEIEEGTPIVSIEKLQSLNGATATKDRLTVVEGDNVTYFITVTNRGTEAALNVTITDKIPAGLSLVENTISDGGSYDKTIGVISWTIESIEVNESKTVSFTISVPDVERNTTWRNVASFTYENDPTNPDVPTPSNEVEIEEGVPVVTINKVQSVNAGGNVTTLQTVKEGDVVTYYITVQNIGTEVATNLVVTDKIPVSSNGIALQLHSIGNGGVDVNGVITWNIAALAIGESVTLDFSVIVPDVKNDTIWRNIAYVVYGNDPTNPEDPTPSNSVDIKEGAPIVKIDKAQSVNAGEKVTTLQSVREGDVVTYYITVQNIGTEAATNLVVTDKVPVSARGIALIVKSIENHGTYNEATGVITWNIATLEVGASVTLEFSVTVPDVKIDTIWKNIAYVSYENNPDNPDDPTQPKYEEPSDEVDIQQGAPLVSIHKTQSIDGIPAQPTLEVVVAGQRVTYYITVGNVYGTEVAENLVVTDKVPVSAKGIALILDETTISHGGTVSDGVITWNIPELAIGQTMTLSFTVTVPSVKEDTIWRNIAYVSYENNPDNPVNPEDPDKKYPSEEVSIEEGVPFVTIKKEQAVEDGARTDQKQLVDAGDKVYYYIIVENNGTGAATGITVTDTVPAGLILDKSSITEAGIADNNGKITWTIAELPVGESITLSFAVTVPTVKEYTTWRNIAHVSYENNPDNPIDPNEPDKEYPSNEVTIEEGVPALTIDKYQAVNSTDIVDASNDKRLTVVDGDKVTYFIKVVNHGTEPARNVVITDAVPVSENGMALTVDSVSEGGNYDNTTGVITWNIETIGRSETVIVSFTVTVPDVSVDTMWRNIAYVSYENNPENPDDPDEPNKEYPSDEVTIIEGVPKIEIEKLQSLNGAEPTKDKLVVVEGDKVTYYIIVRNTGTEDAELVTITDKIPEGLVFDTVQNDGTHNNGIVTWVIDKIEKGSFVTVAFTVIVPDVVEDTTWENTAYVSYENNPENPEDPETPDDPDEPNKEYPSDKVEIQEGAPKVEIHKTQSINGDVATIEVQKVVAGDKVTYYITVTNIGTEDAKNVVITDKIPVSASGIALVLDSISNDGVEADGVITWTIANLEANGGNATVSFTVTVPEVITDTNWKNIAYVTYGNDPGQDPENPDKKYPSEEVEIKEGVPKVELHKEQSINGGTATTEKQVVVAGDKVTYILTITNNGTETAENVIIRDEIPEGLTLDSISDGGVETSKVIEWAIGDLPEGGTKQVSFTVIVPDVAEDTVWKNVASFVYDNEPDDPEIPNDPENPNDPDEPNTSEKVVIEEFAPDVFIKKEQLVNGNIPADKIPTVKKDDKVTYRITITNSGKEVAKNVVIADAIPEGLTLVENSITQNGKLEDGVITWTISSVAANSSVIVEFTVLVPDVAKDTTWKNIAYFAYENDPEDPKNPEDPIIPDKPSEEVEIKEGAPKVELHKAQSLNGGEATIDILTVVAGDQVTYILTIKNTGTETAENVIITDAIPEGLTLVEGSITDNGQNVDDVITWTIGALEVNAEKTVAFTVVVPDVSEDTTWKNVATFTYDNEPDDPEIPNNPENPDDPDEPNTSEEVEIKEGAPKVEINKTQSINGGEATTNKQIVVLGDRVTYYITVKNNGTETATDIVITDAIPEGLILVENSITADGSVADDVITWTIDALEVDASKTVSFTVIVPEVEEDTTWKNVAYVTYGNDPEDPENPEPSNEVEIKEGTPNLAIEKMQALNGGVPTIGTLAVKGGDVVTYYLIVTNNGTETATNVVITDAIPVTDDIALKLVVGSISDGGTEQNGVITWKFDELAVGEKITVSFKVTIPEDEESHIWRNVAHVTCDGDPDGEDSNIVKVVEHEAPPTGDDRKMIPLMILLGASLSTMGLLFFEEKKRKNVK